MKKLILAMASIAMLVACNNDNGLTEDKSLNPEAQNQSSASKKSCKAMELLKKDLNSSATSRANYEAAKLYAEEYDKLLASGRVLADGTIEIPVVFNILYTGSSDRVTDADIDTQIRILNEAFSGTHSRYNTIPNEFKKVAAGDSKIRFKKAGVVRKKTSQTDWVDYTPSDEDEGGIAPTDNTKNLNFYVVPLLKDDGGDYSGYATAPDHYGKTDDGVYLSRKFFGTRNVSADYNLGQTAVHEIGHYLGLEHTFGHDDEGCTTDYISDTPPTTGNSGVPSYPLMIECGGVTRSVMFMNYMDYCDDVANTMFTLKQKSKMLSVLNKSRATIRG